MPWSEEFAKKRKSNFVLGNNQEYKQPRSRAFTQQVEQVQRPDQKNQMESHFMLANDNNKAQIYATTSKRTYSTHENQQPVRLSEERGQDSRATHFNLGNNKLPLNTTNNKAYDTKTGENFHKDQVYMKQIQNGQRGHHHDFKENKNIMFSTKYNEDFQNQDKKLPIQPCPGMEYDHHFVLGNNQIGFETQQKGDFKNTGDLSQRPHKVDIHQSHFQFGIQKDEICTTNDVMYKQQFTRPNKLTDENESDLRRHHIQLGQMGNNYVSQFKDSYLQHSVQQKVNNNHLKMSNIKFGYGQQNQQNSYQTVYSTKMEPKACDRGVARLRTNDTCHNFQLGGYPSDNNTSTQVQKELQIKPQFQHMMQTNFKFSNIQQPSFQTTKMKDTQHRGLNQEQIDSRHPDFKDHHFNLGGHKTGYQSSNKEVHQQINGKRTDLPAWTQKNQKIAHFQFQ